MEECEQCECMVEVNEFGELLQECPVLHCPFDGLTYEYETEYVKELDFHD